MGSISSKYARLVFDAVRPLVEGVGGKCSLATGSVHGHGKLLITVSGVTRSTPLSCSPRNLDDAVKYKVADVRRILREMAR